MDNQDYQQLWNSCIGKIYDPQPVNTDLQYRLIKFAKRKPEELKDLNEIIQQDDDADLFEDHNQAVLELMLLRDELTKIITGMDQAIEGSVQQQRAWHQEELEDPGYSRASEIEAINQANGHY